MVFGLEANGVGYGLTHASGQFTIRGDAQTSVWTMRRSITHVANTWYTLYTDGSSARLTMPIDSLWLVYVQIVGQTSGAAKRWAYNIEGLAMNDGSVTSILTQSVTTLYESDTSYEVQLDFWGGPTDGMDVEVRTTSATDTVRWFARVQTTIVEQ
jgi:hypothetical protein